ncbi:hypothetical protein ARMGADRAFT_1063763 [Armillaria gallica]|uniref:Uncharacterized protein n=1 Tax=Armillaria gallica TaxID=47427 RepID=A0A2H3DAS8_ARMGA|nr:hypothetical protein ARMGADRAFT_1063763 [Armillaria gallica]
MSKLQTVPPCDDSKRSNHTLHLCRIVQSKLHMKEVPIRDDRSCRRRITSGDPGSIRLTRNFGAITNGQILCEGDTMGDEVSASCCRLAVLLRPARPAYTLLEGKCAMVVVKTEPSLCLLARTQTILASETTQCQNENEVIDVLEAAQTSRKQR